MSPSVDPEPPGVSRAGGASLRDLGWIGAWASVLALAVWLSQLQAIWLGVAAVGSAGWLLSGAGGKGVLRVLISILLALGIGVAAGVQVRLGGIVDDWPTVQLRVEERSAAALDEELDRLLQGGEEAVAGAADAALRTSARDDPLLFSRIEELQRLTGVSAIALFAADGSTLAWAGDHRGAVPLAARRGSDAYLFHEGPLFSYLYFVRPLPDGVTATAAFLLEASVDAGEGIVPFAERFERRHGARPRFWRPERTPEQAVWDWATDDGSIFGVTWAELTQQHWWERVVERGRRAAGGLLLLTLVSLSVGWYRASMGGAAVPVIASTSALLIAPLGPLTGADALFSPLQFVLPGPLNVTLGVLTVLGFGIALLALTRRAPRTGPRRPAPVWMVGVGLAVVFPGVVVLIDRAAADGLLASRAAGGFALQLVGALLAAVPAYLLISAGRRTEVPRRGAVLARSAAYALPALGGLALVLAWEPTGRLPLLAAALWALPGLLFLFVPADRPPERRDTGLRLWMLAGWLAVTSILGFLWPMHVRAEMNRVEREVTLLGTGLDPFLDFLLRQFAQQALQLETEGESGVNLLYHSWVRSGLAREGYEARIAFWREGVVEAELNLSDIPQLGQRSLEDASRSREAPVVFHYGGVEGLHYLLAAPLPSGSVVSVAIPPRRRLGDPTSLATFLNPELDPTSVRNHALYLVPVVSEEGNDAHGGVEASRDTVRWIRTDQGWRSEVVVQMPEGPVHAHLVLGLPGLPLLLVRATLLVAAILGSFFGLWLLARMICRELSVQAAFRAPWLRSFRGRLSIALFVFFLLPTIVFGAVSYGAVAREVVRSAAAMAQQALDQAAARLPDSTLGELGAAVRTDLLLYHQGTLVGATAPEVLELGLFHTWLPPSVHLRFAGGEDLQELEARRIAAADYLVAYRRIDPGSVLAAPIPLASNEISRRQEEFRDIALVVILAGLLLSLVLALLVSRALSSPLDELSRAALTVGGGNLRTRLPETRSDEFGSVYRSFNRMVGRLDRTRAALVQETRRTETIVAEAATGVLALDADGRVELVNPRAAEILGGGVSRGDRLLDPARSDGPFSAAVMELIRSPNPEASAELDLGGQIVRLRLRRLPAEEGSGGAVIALEDVTAELRTARVLAWGEMARQVAHEIKNPLTPIKLAVQHLRRAFFDRRPDFDQILERNVESILLEIERLGEISRAFSRFGTPAATTTPLEAVDVARTVAEVLALYRGAEDGKTFRSELPDPLPPAVARTGELKEVLLNLLENAREAIAPGGEVVITASVESPTTIRLIVRDDGAGIPAESLPSIFEPHFSTRSSGTGLGLAIVRRIVDSWGGEIDVVSTPGAGSTFVIRLRASGSPAAPEWGLPHESQTERTQPTEEDTVTDLKRGTQSGGDRSAGQRPDGGGGPGRETREDAATRGTDRDFDESGESTNQGHGHTADDRGDPRDGS
jgi:two-component system, NtrC family, nitrogen regulation sensor histidine kinase NtrY